MGRRERKARQSLLRKPALLVVRLIRLLTVENGQGDAVMGKREIDFQDRIFFGEPGEARQNPHSSPAVARLFEQDAIALARKGMWLKERDGARPLSFHR